MPRISEHKGDHYSDTCGMRDAFDVEYDGLIDPITETTKSSGRVHSGTRRLWRPLSYRASLPTEIKELDRIGERINGTFCRLTRTRRKLRKIAIQVIHCAHNMATHGERAFAIEIETAHDSIRRGEQSIDARIHAFAVVYEAIRRTISISLYPEQIMGGWAMADGALIEMLTGEGKTVTGCLPAAIQAWSGFGVHVLTVNDYLAKRDSELNSEIFKKLNLTVGVIQDQSESEERRNAYSCDITYATDKQVIFDYLRDRLRSPMRPRVASLLLDEIIDTGMFDHRELWTGQVVQRGLHSAIVDEADSVLVDEATTPAIIGALGGEDEESAQYYQTACDLAAALVESEDYSIDLSQHRVDLTNAGREKLEATAHDLPPFWSGPRRREELVSQALTARHLFALEDHYIVRDDDVQIVDSGTGRVLDGRQWQLGLHQAIQAKEGITVTRSHETQARVSYQRFFQMYQNLSGMTGTAWEVRHEIWHNFHMPVVRIPTHKPMIRKQKPDRIYPNQDKKYHAIADAVLAIHKTGQPILVGTRSVEASEVLSVLIAERGVSHQVLNAIRHEEEAQIIAQAGKQGAVTVATNMAGIFTIF